MCEPKPGRRCAADSCPTAEVALERYADTYPGAVDVNPLGEAEVTYRQSLDALGPDVAPATQAEARAQARRAAAERVASAEAAYEAAPPGRNMKQRLALEDAYQDLTVADLDIAFPDRAVRARTPEAAAFRLSHGINAVVRKVGSGEPFTADDAAEAPVGTLVQGSGAGAEHHWYKHGSDRWAHMRVRGGVPEYGDWAGHINPPVTDRDVAQERAALSRKTGKAARLAH